MKKILLLIFFSFFCYLEALSPQNLHASFLLADCGREEEAKEILINSFSRKTADVEFIAEQFVNWIRNQPTEMEENFNRSAYFVVKGNKNLAKKAITNFHSLEHNQLSEFATTFVDWGFNLLETYEVLTQSR
ncbi:MAG: hypothetical protein KDK59_11490 [Simkania sp.]|nr:hypothetical protein [Simkania sp.]